MTDRINSITLILEEDIRIDDAEHLLDVLKKFRGVIEVKPNVVRSPDMGAISSRRDNEWTKALHKLINDFRKW